MKAAVGPAGAEFTLPVRPAVLAELSAEIHAEDPDCRRVSALVNKDLGLAAAVISTANSPYFGVSGRIASVQQAINFLGLSQVFSLVTGAMLRRAFPQNDALVEAIWDLAVRRAALMARLARNTDVPTDYAYTAGLFQDCGVILLATLAPAYRQVWEKIRWLPEATDIEMTEYEIDHAMLSSLLVEHWGLPADISQAVAQHHRIAGLEAHAQSKRVCDLVALSVLADYVLVRALGEDAEAWEMSFGMATTMLDVPPMTSETWVEQAGALLATSH